MSPACGGHGNSTLEPAMAAGQHRTVSQTAGQNGPGDEKRKERMEVWINKSTVVFLILNDKCSTFGVNLIISRLLLYNPHPWVGTATMV